ncbi:MAG TPA: hypothetical protein VHB25_09690 [Gemmatimonadaceae bacterium]|nr:hypothetical protein [Gemmatimonadaceae bacterium]
MRRLIVVAMLAAAAARPVRAQIGPMPRGPFTSQPQYWVGLSYGYLAGTTIVQDAEIWDFAYTSQIRATLEKAVQRDFTIGVSAGFANASLNASVDHPVPAGVCATNCPETAEITQLLAFVNGGSGAIGFHALYNLEAGLTQFANFRDASTGTRGSISATDFTFGLGGGIGYRISPLADAYVSEQGDFILDSPAPGTTQSNAPRQFTFRVGFRYGF